MTKAEYLLILIEEEALEIAHRCTKARRFGLNEIQQGQPHTNAHRIEREINDLRAALELFKMQEPLFRIDSDRQQIDAHKLQILSFMEYSRALGILQ